MGKRGPKKTPTAILQQRGSWRAETRPNEPQPDDSKPVCPSWITEEGKRVWRRVTPKLKKCGLLTNIDGEAFLRYCEIYALFRQAAEFIKTNGTTYVTRDGQGKATGVAQWPQVQQMLKSSESLSRLEAKFGMTPADRPDIRGIPEPLKLVRDDFFGNEAEGAG